LLNKPFIDIMKRNLSVLHFLFVFFASALLTGCETTTGVATQDAQDSGESVKTVMVSTIAGSEEGFADGIGRNAKFYGPVGIASDAAGNLYVTDFGNHRIRKITPAGEVSTFAGSEKGFADGIGGDARFNLPTGIASDAADNLYVTDIGNHRIRKITPAGKVSTLAGSEEGFADGIGSAAQFRSPTGIASDAVGNLYVTDTFNHRIRKITPAGEVTTLAGSEEGFADGIGSDARFNLPSGIAIDAAGHLYMADGGNHRIRKLVFVTGHPYTVMVSTVADNVGGFPDGFESVAKREKIFDPSGIASDAAGNLYVAEAYGQRIRKITPAGEVSTLAGGERGFADGVGSDARFNQPSGIAIGVAGNLYVADFGGHRIRKIEIRRP
jgi:DNA-binding beta-propeller fold protein YncE